MTTHLGTQGPKSSPALQCHHAETGRNVAGTYIMFRVRYRGIPLVIAVCLTAEETLHKSGPGLMFMGFW